MAEHGGAPSLAAQRTWVSGPAGTLLWSHLQGLSSWAPPTPILPPLSLVPGGGAQSHVHTLVACSLTVGLKKDSIKSKDQYLGCSSSK